MKFLKLQVIILTLFLIVQVNAQEKSACTVGAIKFACPEKITVLTVDNENDVFVGLNSKDDVYVYAYSPDKQISKDDLINTALEKAFSKIFLTKYTDYKVKDSDDFWGKSAWSQYETDKFAKVGFNNKSNHFIHFQYVLLSFKEKQIVAGFLYERKDRTSRLNPEEEFNGWKGGGNGNASSNLQKLITSITGEKRTQVTPGGPPPPASPK